jgi:hypothetical protein
MTRNTNKMNFGHQKWTSAAILIKIKLHFDVKWTSELTTDTLLIIGVYLSRLSWISVNILQIFCTAITGELQITWPFICGRVCVFVWHKKVKDLN